MNNTPSGVEIFLGYNCNLSCKFCFQKDLRKQVRENLGREVVEKIILDGFNKEKRSIFFSGGDPCIDPNLFYYIAYSRDLGYTDIRIHTNGLILSSKQVFEKYIKAGVNGFIVSIHGYGPIHDLLVGREGGFEKVKEALLAFVELKKEYPHIILDTNTVLTRYNYKTLYNLFKFLSLFPITRSQLVQLYSLDLFSLKEKKDLYVSYEDFDTYLGKILTLENINITLENFPFCKINKKYYPHILERRIYNNDAYGHIGVSVEEDSGIYIDKCSDCEFTKICNGIPKDYVEVFSKEKYFTI